MARKVGIMISAPKDSKAFEDGITSAENSLKEAQVYLYLIDGAVEGLSDVRFEKFKAAGGHLFACAYSLQKRGLNPAGAATQSGLTVLSDIMSSTEEFQSFN